MRNIKLKPNEYISENRGKFELSPKDARKLRRGPGYYGQITNLKDGKKYHLHGESCGIDTCFCAVVILTDAEHTAVKS